MNESSFGMLHHFYSQNSNRNIRPYIAEIGTNLHLLKWLHKYRIALTFSLPVIFTYLVFCEVAGLQLGWTERVHTCFFSAL